MKTPQEYFEAVLVPTISPALRSIATETNEQLRDLKTSILTLINADFYIRLSPEGKTTVFQDMLELVIAPEIDGVDRTRAKELSQRHLTSLHSPAAAFVAALAIDVPSGSTAKNPKRSKAGQASAETPKRTNDLWISRVTTALEILKGKDELAGSHSLVTTLFKLLSFVSNNQEIPEESVDYLKQLILAILLNFVKIVFPKTLLKRRKREANLDSSKAKNKNKKNKPTQDSAWMALFDVNAIVQTVRCEFFLINPFSFFRFTHAYPSEFQRRDKQLGTVGFGSGGEKTIRQDTHQKHNAYLHFHWRINFASR